jgi:CDP-glycerol glycerophosphotransferase (TagB/SpsB family)
MLGLVMPSPWTPIRFWSNPIILEFAAGVVIAYLFRANTVRTNTAAAVGVIIVGVAWAWLCWAFDREGAVIHPVLQQGVPAAMIVFGATVLLPQTYAERVSAIWLLVGDSSYALYLSHRFPLRVVSVLWGKVVGFSPALGWAFIALCCAICIVVAVLVYRFVERPIINFLSRKSPTRAAALSGQAKLEAGMGKPDLKRRIRLAGKLVLLSLVTLVDNLVPKKRGLVICGADGGKRYAEGPRQFFEYIQSVNDFDAYWITRSRSVLSQLNGEWPGRGLWWLSPRAVWLGVRSQFRVISHSRRDVQPIGFSSARRIIHLTHGIPLKSMGLLQIASQGAAERRQLLSHLNRENKAVLWMVATSENVGRVWAESYNMPESRLAVVGMPRNDRILDAKPTLRSVLGIETGKIVLYAPTYRDWKSLDACLPTPDTDLKRVIEVLEANDAYLLLRPHYYESNAAKSVIESAKSPRVLAADSAIFPDVGDILSQVDVLITDYSSIFFDFMLLDKPIIFTPYDMDEYLMRRGMSFKYDDVTPGPKALNGNDFLLALKDSLGECDRFADRRKDVTEAFHKFRDARSSERLAALLRGGKDQ